MNDIQRLRRSYRRLMWAYPRWYRQERGLEILTALLDDAAPGQRRPTRDEAIDLLFSGVRTRLKAPRNIVARGAAVMVTMYLALACAAGAVALSGYLGPPSEEQAMAVAMEAVPIQPHNVPGPAVQCLYECPEWDGHDDVVAIDAPLDHTDSTRVYLSLPQQNSPAVLAQARERLSSTGWEVGSVRTSPDGSHSVDAAKDGLRVWLHDEPLGLGHGYGVVTADVSKRPEALTFVDLAAGFVGGILLGWLLAVWALQRFQRHSLSRRVWATFVAAPFFVGTFFVLQGALFLTIGLVASGDLPDKIPMIALLLVPGFWWPITAVINGSAVLALGLLGLPRRNGGAPPEVPQTDFGVLT